jgi:hypothetical protein
MMELVPYNNLMRHIVIAELTQRGWVDLIRMPIDDPHEATPEMIQKTIEQVREMLVENDKAYFDIQGEAICIAGITKGKTLKVYADE